MTSSIKVGDQVVYRGGWGMDPARIVTVTGLEVTDMPREKYGEPRDEVRWEVVEDNRVMFTVSDGHWAYSEQIDIEASKALAKR